jgi:hypothetical protein
MAKKWGAVVAEYMLFLRSSTKVDQAAARCVTLTKQFDDEQLWDLRSKMAAAIEARGGHFQETDYPNYFLPPRKPSNLYTRRHKQFARLVSTETRLKLLNWKCWMMFALLLFSDFWARLTLKVGR